MIASSVHCHGEIIAFRDSSVGQDFDLVESYQNVKEPGDAPLSSKARASMILAGEIKIPPATGVEPESTSVNREMPKLLMKVELNVETVGETKIGSVRNTSKRLERR